MLATVTGTHAHAAAHLRHQPQPDAQHLCQQRVVPPLAQRRHAARQRAQQLRQRLLGLAVGNVGLQAALEDAEVADQAVFFGGGWGG
jgi:hypothetical protein